MFERVVVVSAGNEGPGPMTIGEPGNVPYFISIGALTDNHTPFDPTDDRLASFSSTGPPYKGFVKPEVVAPGGHMVGSMWYQSYLANIDPGSMQKNDAITSSAIGCANQGLNVTADLAGTQHFGGPANQDASGNYYVMNMAGSTWGAPASADGYTWTSGYTWAKGYTWSQGYTWAKGYTWSQGYT